MEFKHLGAFRHFRACPGNPRKPHAGHGQGVNNPANQAINEDQDQQNAGPLPRGTYTIGKQQDNVTGIGRMLYGSMRLTPDPGNEMFGRGGFLMHGDNAAHNQTASEGCAVLPPPARDIVGQSGINAMHVDQ